MNTLIVGTDKTPLLHHLPDRFLLIDDGPIVDLLDIPPRRAVTHFNAQEHTINPLKDMSYKRARDFVSILNAVFPEGDNTLTRRYSNYILLKALLARPKNLASLVPASKDTMDAYQQVQTLLLSPVLKRVLTNPTNMSLKGTVVARLDRAVLGDFDAFVLGNLLASLYDGPVVIPDFGFYACALHRALIRQGRLNAGVNSFDEVPDFRNELLLIERKLGRGCTPDDAKLLALYAGILPNSNAYNDFIQTMIRPPLDS